MKGASPPGQKGELRSQIGTAALLFVLGTVLYVVTLMYYHRAPTDPIPQYFDLDVFQTAGRMTLQGQAIDTYNPAAFFAAEKAATGGRITQILPWAYPPQFNLLAALLALLPAYQACLLLEGAGLGVLLLLLRRLSGAPFAGTLAASAPLMLPCVALGQNGFLMGALAAWFALASLRENRWAGVPLGLMIIKPHLALGLGLYVLLRRDGGVLAIALATVLASASLATLILTPAIWPAFLGGLGETSRLLAQDSIPHVVMISAYGALRSLGAPLGAALGGQAAVAFLAADLILAARLRRLGRRVELGIAAVATLAFSPYAFAYDLPLLSVGIALLWPALAARIPVALRLLVVALSTEAGLAYPAAMLAMGTTAGGAARAIAEHAPAYPAIGFLVILAATAIAAARAPRPAAET